MGGSELLPGIGLALLETEGNAALLLIDVENLYLNGIADIDNLGRMDVLVGPVHLGDVYETLNALLDLNEAAVVGKVGYLAGDLGADRVALGNINPGISAELLESERYTGTLTVKLQDLDLNLVADIDDLGRMLDALPGHISDVEKSVNAAEVNECAVVGEVLDDTLDDLAFLEVGEKLLSLSAVGVLENIPAGNNDVVALGIDLLDAELELLALEMGNVLDRTYIYERAREECADAGDVNSKAALDLAVDDTNDIGSFVSSFLELVPSLKLLGLLA